MARAAAVRWHRLVLWRDEENILKEALKLEVNGSSDIDGKLHEFDHLR